ncbi:MAG: polysaccharide deacetylase [Sphingosinicella sp.]|uniref:polysaccharide deacetylase n=1 Tax=Sphingosinicella sp. TaxID=1917971 RepID=UPI0040377A09
MATRVLLTVDTELTWRHFAAGGGWCENFVRSVEPAGVGISYQLKRLAEHGLSACFFVDPMPALVYGLEPVRRMIEPILDAGQEVQLHLHSFWHDLAQGNRDDARFELTKFDAAAQRELIEQARGLLMAAGAPAPVAFRSGSYAADADTLRPLRDLGFAWDSSHNGADHPWPSALPLDPALIDPAPCEGVTEIPVSQIRRADGGLRPFQLCALSRQEMKAALSHAAHHGHPTTTIVSHSFELATRDGKRVNKLVRGRFDWLCRFLAANEATMPTMRFDALTAAPPAEPGEPLPPRRLRTARRMAEQAVGAALYEKPLVGAALVALPPLAAFEELVVHAGL